MPCIKWHVGVGGEPAARALIQFMLHDKAPPNRPPSTRSRTRAVAHVCQLGLLQSFGASREQPGFDGLWARCDRDACPRGSLGVAYLDGRLHLREKPQQEKRIQHGAGPWLCAQPGPAGSMGRYLLAFVLQIRSHSNCRPRVGSFSPVSCLSLRSRPSSHTSHSFSLANTR